MKKQNIGPWHIVLVCLLGSMSACVHEDEFDPQTADMDDDGFSIRRGDCNDRSKVVHPEALEVCDGVDNNCDSSTDEPTATDAKTWVQDSDGDDHGNPNITQKACVKPDGYVLKNGHADCDDTNPHAWDTCETCKDADGDTHFFACNRFPNLADCNDEDPDNWSSCSSCKDGDGDGYFVGCDQYSLREEDCDDTRPHTWKQCGDCTDADGDRWFVNCDSYDKIGAKPDCDDTNAAISPETKELCDTVDNDCDGQTDEPEAEDARVWYVDFDGDGLGKADSNLEYGCTQPNGKFVENHDDCDDANNTIQRPIACYLDHDGDKHGDPGNALSQCVCDTDRVHNDDDCDDANPALNWHDMDRDGFTSCAPEVAERDCNDAHSWIHPRAIEICDAVDNDCDGRADEDDAADATVWSVDKDQDGFGTPHEKMVRASCVRPFGYADNPDDCDDTDSRIKAAAAWYQDADADGFGDPNITQTACQKPAGFVDHDSDCDDARADRTPADADHDGFSTCAGDCDDTDAVKNLRDEDRDGYSTCTFDCDDTDPGVNLTVPELCNGKDDNCNGVKDENSAKDATTSFYDGDRDGHGNPHVPLAHCGHVPGYVADHTDCDDAQPFAWQRCATCADADGDGYYTGCDAYPNEGTVDCNDDDPLTFPGAAEVCEDGRDQDCDETDALCPEVVEPRVEKTIERALPLAAAAPSELSEPEQAPPSCTRETASKDAAEFEKMRVHVQEKQKEHERQTARVATFLRKLQTRARAFDPAPPIPLPEKRELRINVAAAKVGEKLDEATCVLHAVEEAEPRITTVALTWPIILALFEERFTATAKNGQMDTFFAHPLTAQTPLEGFVEEESLVLLADALNRVLSQEANLKKAAAWFFAHFLGTMTEDRRKEAAAFVSQALTYNRSGYVRGKTDARNDLVLVREFWLIRLANELGDHETATTWGQGFLASLRDTSNGLILKDWYRSMIGKIL